MRPLETLKDVLCFNKVSRSCDAFKFQESNAKKTNRRERHLLTFPMGMS